MNNAPRYCIGIMSKNIVDACISYVNTYESNLIFIPSRRQVDYDGGYANNWNTEEFSKYVRKNTDRILLQRDHGGPDQGNIKDDGLKSLGFDSIYFDLIHIDPWRFVNSFKEGCERTKNLIEHCYKINKNVEFEVGTEESIFKYDHDKLYELISYLKNNLRAKHFKQIRFAVIQSGTALTETRNIGLYNKNKLTRMLSVCKEFDLLSKEHNGDYLPLPLIKEKFDYGLDSINIAPEFGKIETMTYLTEIKDSELFDVFFDICYKSRKWEKWVDETFFPFNRKDDLIKISGHYVLTNIDFLLKIKNKMRSDIDIIIRENIIKKLLELNDK